MSALGFEPTRNCLQWILNPPPQSLKQADVRYTCCHIFEPLFPRTPFPKIWMAGPFNHATNNLGGSCYHRHCVRAVKEMDSKSIGLCPQGFESPRRRFEAVFTSIAYMDNWCTPCGTRTRNLRIRSPTPCPLGQGGMCQ